MTPKEKALKLVNEMYNVNNTELHFQPPMSYEDAKGCALIAIKEVLKAAFYANDEIYDHYLEVRQELEKL
jgi:hypothetical protein